MLVLQNVMEHTVNLGPWNKSLDYCTYHLRLKHERIALSDHLHLATVEPLNVDTLKSGHLLN